MKRFFAILLAIVALAAMPFSRAAAQKEQVLDAAQRFFDAMLKKDTTALRILVHPNAQLYATTETADSVVVRTSNRDQFLAQVSDREVVLLERMWNAEVRISGSLAAIWTPYDFHLGTTWSHCGIDSFQMVKSTKGWQVLTIAYTIVRAADRCKNPLGPPR